MTIGNVNFNDDEIFIEDDTRGNNILLILSAAGWIVFGTLSFYRHYPNDELFYIELFIAAVNLIIFITLLFRSSRNKISRDEIKSITFKSRFGREFVDIKLNNWKVRRIINIESYKPELQKHFNSFLSS